MQEALKVNYKTPLLSACWSDGILFDGVCMYCRNDVMWQKLLFCDLSVLCDLFIKSMLLILQALVLYSKISPWNSKNNIPHILPPCQKKTLLFSLSKKPGLCK